MVQVALVIRGLGICDFDYSRGQKMGENCGYRGKFHKFKPKIAVLVFADPNFSGT